MNLTGGKSLKERLKSHFPRVPASGALLFGIVLIAFILIVSLQYLHSRLLMNFEFRFFVPFFPIFLFFFALFFSTGIEGVQGIKSAKPALFNSVTVSVIILLIGQMGINLRELDKYIYHKSGYKKLIESEHIPAGLFLKENVPPAEWLVVIHDTGAIPYYSGLKTVDFSRLNDEYLARNRLSPAEIVDYFYSFKPGAVVITSSRWDKIDQLWYYGREAETIKSDPRFANYILVKKYGTDIAPEHPSHDYFEFVFLRRDLAEKLALNDS